MQKSWHLLWRCLVVALVYTASNTLVGALVMPAEDLRTPTSPALLLTTTFLSGFLIAATLGPLGRLLSASRLKRVFIWATAIFLLLAAVVIEGYFYAPGLLPLAVVPRVLALHALAALATSLALVFLFPPRPSLPATEATTPRPALARAGRFALSAAAYLLFYYFFGAINYVLVTGPYYETLPQLAVPPAATVLMVVSLRAVLLVLSVTPLLAALRVSRSMLVVASGGVLFVLGGVVPLLLQAGALPPVLLLASGVEIFFQNFLTGAVAALLLGRPTALQQAAAALPTPEP